MAVRMRRAGPADAIDVATVYLASFHARYSFPLAHTDDEVRAWIRSEVESSKETWVAEVGPSVVGMMVLDGGELEQLYVHPDWWRQGIGHRLLDLAKERRPDGLVLYTFQENVGARAFYERHGFAAVGFGDGSGNEERQPDVRYAWRTGPQGPEA
ncbi:MAG TPA: GNAT family N-acetyltransferase [Candidatus Binatia bacterium]|nr:GNAT family N-acetyltransferase [Candidatus Binatia bacterium]